MKTCNETLAAYLASRPSSLIAPCVYTFLLADGTAIYLTDADVPVVADGITYLADSVRLSGLKSSSKIGVEVAEQTLTIAATVADVVQAGDFVGVPWLAAIQQGLLDGAYVTRDRAFLPGWGQPAIGTVNLFYGRVAGIDKVGRTVAQIKVKSDLVALDIDFPRNLYTPTCRWTLFGYGCGLGKADFTHGGAVGAGVTDMRIPWGGATAAAFTQGTLTFTSGDLTGVTFSISGSDGSALTLSQPMPELPAEGDTFEATWGCDHTPGLTNGTPDTPAHGCHLFGNNAKYGGFPFVPQVETGI